MKKSLSLIVLLGWCSCAVNRTNDCCHFDMRQEKIIGICEVKFSRLYGDSVYLLDNITINYSGNRVGLSYGSILNACPLLQKYKKKQPNIGKFYPWLATKFISNGANIFTKLGSKDVYMVYGLEMQGLSIKAAQVKSSCRNYLYNNLYSGFGEVSILKNSNCIIPTHYDDIFEVPIGYLTEQKLFKIASLRPFEVFIRD